MASERTPLDGVDVILADLDGVVYRGALAIPHAVESLTAASTGRKLGFITNNASRTPASVAAHLRDLGLGAAADEIVTSPQAAVRLLVELIPAGSTVLVVGGEGLTSAVAEAGFAVTRSADDAPAAVVQGFAPDVGWRHLAEASFALRGTEDSVPWVATNTDWTLPLERGTAPGNGTLVSAVHTAVGRLPIVAGKPEAAIFEAARDRFQARNPLVIGDRLDTDILGANRAGMPAALVLTGVDAPKQVLAADAQSRPRYLLEDLRQLAEPYPEVVERERGDSVDTVVGKSVVRRRGHVLTVRRRGERRIDLLRAGAAAIWNSGLAIYGLQVPEELYS